MSIHSVINCIRKRPGMYLGSNSITALSHFLNGYTIAESDFGADFQRELFTLDFHFMHDFVKMRFNEENNIGWCNNILNYCDNNEEKGLEIFFELYDEFKNIKMKRCYKAVLSEENIQYNNNMKYTHTMRGNAPEPVFKNPLAVYVIELDISAFIAAVETDTYIRLEHQFFTSLENAKSGSIPFGVEMYFKKITEWREYFKNNISFDKIIKYW